MRAWQGDIPGAFLCFGQFIWATLASGTGHLGNGGLSDTTVGQRPKETVPPSPTGDYPAGSGARDHLSWSASTAAEGRVTADVD